MTEPLRFHPSVPSDLSNAISWYDEISPNLANRFRDSVDLQFDRIENDPEMFAIAFEDIRVIRVTGFPYLVEYRLRENIPTVMGVFHSASDPTKWRTRAKS